MWPSGLTPQSVNKLGGYRVQGRDQEQATKMLDDAKQLENAGADLLVLECVPTQLAADITKAVSMPVIGIGAGPDTDAQVLVAYDMLGITQNLPRFVKNYLTGNNDVLTAFKVYNQEVKEGVFPAKEHSFD